ncbi:AMP-binding protein, partial [Methylocucumis oryzae]
ATQEQLPITPGMACSRATQEQLPITPGMACSRATQEQLPRQPKTLFNAYGPTEAVITPLVWQAETSCSEPYAPIGFPVGHRRAYVLDINLNPLPVGVAGELYLGGELLAQGYYRRPALTAERFIPDPFSSTPGARLYRTGDRVRQSADGCFSYLGRLDNQVKLRGFRIELGEIESVLLKQPGINEAVALLKSVNTVTQLCAYIAAILTNL